MKNARVEVTEDSIRWFDPFGRLRVDAPLHDTTLRKGARAKRIGGPSYYVETPRGSIPVPSFLSNFEELRKIVEDAPRG
jgi:hypothetical protein